MTVSEWIDRFGEGPVNDLARRLGGQRVYIRSEGRLHSKLYASLGDAAELLRCYSGLRIEIPNQRSVRREIERRIAFEDARALILNGQTDRAVARATGLHRITVAKIRTAST